MLDTNNYLGKVLAERYRLVRVIGRGASSAVFYAEDMMARREDGSALPVAVKLLDRDSGEYKMNSRSFRTEIQAVASIPTNPHIVAIKEVSSHEEDRFIVMEYVNGKTLGEYIKEKGGRLPAKEIVSIALQLLQALRVAHGAGVVHRDIKPENIIVERRDAVGKQVDIPGGPEMPFVKLTDFGIALLPDEDLFAMKDKGVGTVYYISPEQVSGVGADARSDLYALGVLMHEMATGHVPFAAQSPTGIISKHQTEMPNHVRGENASIPMMLDEVIFTAMQKNPAARYPDALAMERRLREVMQAIVTPGVSADAASIPLHNPTEGVTEVARKTRLPKERKAKQMSKATLMRLGIGGGAVVLATLIVLGAVFLLPSLLKKTYDITIPKLVGTIYSEDNAYADGITVDPATIVYEYSDTVAKGKVIRQSPAPGVVLRDVVGVDLILTVSLGPEMVEFAIPEAYRADADTAIGYLRNTYDYLRVVSVKQSPVSLENVAPGTVIGAYRFSTSEDLSLDGAEVFKNMSEEIVLLVQPEKRVSFEMVLDDIISVEAATEYFESNYPFLHVVGSEAAPASDPNRRIIAAGVVIGVRLANGTVISTFRTETRRLSVDTLDMESDIVLLVATGEDVWIG